MPISARYCPFAPAAPPWATPQDALALLQHEMERRFAETLFGAEGLSPEAEVGVSRQSINSIERQRYEPSLALALTFARVFGLAIEKIFSLEEKK